MASILRRVDQMLSSQGDGTGTTEQNVATYRGQLRRLGLAHDQRRSVSTTDPTYYRWTQWIFSQIFNAWYDTELDRARPSDELIEAFETGERTTPDGVEARRREAAGG